LQQTKRTKKRARYFHALLDFVGRVMVFNAPFNNDLAILWQLVLLAEESGIPGENHRQVAESLNSDRQLQQTKRTKNAHNKPLI
jgi:hypothetical protein